MQDRKMTDQRNISRRKMRDWKMTDQIARSKNAENNDHFPIFTKLSVDRTPLPPPTFRSFSRYHSIDIDSFLADLQCSRLITYPPKSLGFLLIAYNTTLSSLFDKHAPVITRFSSRKSKSNPWFTSTLCAFKSTVRHAENIWKRTHSALDWSAFKSLSNRYHNLILASKKTILCQSSLFIF